MQTDVLATRRFITELFGSQLGAARALHFSERAVRWWCQHGAPPHIIDALVRYADGEISLRWTRALMQRRRRRNGR